jgi:uncharacterized protein YutE (UPF0331/DUF86 family)
LKEELKQRLLRHLDFLEAEIKEYIKFAKFSAAEYRDDSDKRRNVERWVENIINSSIDISKVILTLEGRNLPDNYKDIVLLISVVKGLGIDSTESLSRWVKFRNIVSHEYLDIRWSTIKKFISETEPLYNGLLEKARAYLKKKIEEDKGKNSV